MAQPPYLDIRSHFSGFVLAVAGRTHREQVSEVVAMISIGMIHMDCDCGAELFYVGDTAEGKPPTEVIELFKAKLGPGEFGFFSSANGAYGECPYCGLSIELPEPELMDWLPFMKEEQFMSALDKILDASTTKDGSRVNGTSTHLDRV